MAVAIDSDEARRCFLGVLVTNELAMATADDVILHNADTDLPYSIVAMTQLAGHLWFAQAEARIGRLTEEALDAVRAGHAWTDNDFQRTRRGVPLQDASRDLRWPYLEAEVQQMEELAMHCTLRRRENDWAGPQEALGQYIREETEATLAAYSSQPILVLEHASVEEDTAHGGYQHRQLFELVQNSADALWADAGEREMGSATPVGGHGRIEVRLTANCLYCADDGEPIDADGVKALMFSHLSPKRVTSQIGTFGLGFKALLGVSDTPEFFSRSGSFRFDRDRARRRIEETVPDAERCPVLRLPEPIDPADFREQDEVLQDLMAWAVNIVRLPLRRGARDDLRLQMVDFPAEFLLFVAHVASLKLIDDSGSVDRELALKRVDDDYLLADGDATAQWRLFEDTHRLSSDARADRRPGDDCDEVPIWWAAPVDRLNRPGKFWAFFPTATQSLVPGILNAPWKTNEDRQNLLAGRYNDELIAASAALIADSLPLIRSNEDPARHLDVLPRRHEAGDPHQADLLRKRLFTALHGRAVVPDQDGALRQVSDISYPPLRLTPDRGMDLAPFERWAAYPNRPKDWLHHRALTRARLAAIDRLFQAPDEPTWRTLRAPRESLATWLGALVRRAAPGEAVGASMAAIQTAALISWDRRTDAALGRIVLTESGSWSEPDPQTLFLPVESLVGDSATNGDSTVHPDLTADEATLSALKSLGLKPPSPEGRFRAIANRVLADRGGDDPGLLEEFWRASQALRTADAHKVISEHDGWRLGLAVRTRTGGWKPPYSVLVPGAIVPGDGSRDDGVTVDFGFHQPDEELLRALGVVDTPCVGCDLRGEPLFASYQKSQEQQYRRQDLPMSPQAGFLDFVRYKGVGPLGVLPELSEEAAAAYTDALLSLDGCYEPWIMWHTGTNRETYPKMECESLPLRVLREHGQVETPAGIVPLADALGPQPASPAALHALLRHPNAERIKQAFDLSDPVPEVFGEGDPTPLTDIWPGLREHLPMHQRNARLVLCERIRVAGAERLCIAHGNDVYLVGGVEDDERAALENVAEALDLHHAHRWIEEVLQRRTPAEIEERHEAVRRCSTDAERLLVAVGEDDLRLGLPRSLLDVLEDGEESLEPIEVAEAVIATFHTDALRSFLWALDDLGPPAKWSGSPLAVAFVRSLGFSDKWAGEQKRTRPAHMEIDGPRSLPPLHDYQRRVAANVREMLRSGGSSNIERRGMVSMPTGSGKTRVAVQAIVEAMRDDGFGGGVLWVADRDELCEQAVEAWAQVWRSEGGEAEQLRISRMWSGQPRPLPTTENHVVVATIQTLNVRLSNWPGEYEFLKDFTLAVFDEAHRAVARTFTSVMQEIGLTYRRREDEPFLVGLTATPYRGHDEAETRRLVGRFGHTRLDRGAFSSDDPQLVVKELQDMGVLAQADHEVIEGGTFRLRPEEWDEISRFVRGPERRKHMLAWLPQSVDDRIARSAQRTRRILEAYDKHIALDWPTLIFATSVEHAQTLAALLNRRGTCARAVSGRTEPAARRRIVEGFRNGEIKALVNYGVFREGFDAPKTRAIIVARPVYSPNLYFQMIGRGLRGPLNGGDDRCLILNVRDNIEGFGKSLAFADLDWLWDQ
ncbi:MAG: DEAD/DEAH box helicase [bacterium]|nr:DEAD/DEAH box helicase [bacterium]